MRISRWRKVFLGTTLTLAVGSGSMALLGAEKISDMLGLLGLLYKGMVMANDQNQLVNDFLKQSKYCVVITNKSSAPWTFGYLGNRASEVGTKQSGTVTLKTVTSDFRTWADLGAKDPDSAAVPIPSRYGAIVINPVVTKTGIASWEPFFRVCYLEDASHHRIYLNISKGTGYYAVPEVGIAAESHRDVMRDTGTGAKVLEIFAPGGIKEKRLQGLDMIAIGVETVR